MSRQYVKVSPEEMKRIEQAKIRRKSYAKPGCTRDCKPGKDSPCPISAGCDNGNLSCVQVHELLTGMGVKRITGKSACVKAAMMYRIIKVTGTPSDLDMVICSDEANCGHEVSATLRSLLNQPDFGGNDYESGLEKATVRCRKRNHDPDDVENGITRTYVTGICNGSNEFDCGKFHNHCTDCPAFGICLGDYREAHCVGCEEHYHSTFGMFSCPRCQGLEDNQDEEDD